MIIYAVLTDRPAIPGGAAADPGTAEATSPSWRPPRRTAVDLGSLAGPGGGTVAVAPTGEARRTPRTGPRAALRTHGRAGHLGERTPGAPVRPLAAGAAAFRHGTGGSPRSPLVRPAGGFGAGDAAAL